MQTRISLRARRRVAALAVALAGIAWSFSAVTHSQTGTTDPITVLGFNELGMHCMNEDFSEICILPPFNTLRAQVVDRSGGEPRIVTSGVTLQYSIPGNTHSADKTNFWDFAAQLFGVELKPNIGLTGNGLRGTMTVTPQRDWTATGIPITQISDNGKNDPYQLAQLTVYRNGQAAGQTRIVVPVSWEISCNLCHGGEGRTVPTDILQKHDRLHGTSLEQQKPVLCARCHADAALGTTGSSGVPPLSIAMHRAHASRVASLNLTNSCYACHPGFRSQCQRDVHLSKGMTCTTCHGTMEAVGNPSRRPWVDEPTCGGCHKRTGFEFEQANTLYKNSVGHMGVQCGACHGSPHAITPTATQADNLQALAAQGHAGKIDTCTVCHRTKPNEAFPHRRTDD